MAADQAFGALYLQAGCEFLIAETAAGLLDLSDVYVTDDESGISARPTVNGEMPAIAELYQEVPWTVEFLGDAVFSKDPEERVRESCVCTSTLWHAHRNAPMFLCHGVVPGYFQLPACGHHLHASHC